MAFNHFDQQQTMRGSGVAKPKTTLTARWKRHPDELRLLAPNGASNLLGALFAPLRDGLF
jgi:hypothetical protein